MNCQCSNRYFFFFWSVVGHLIEVNSKVCTLPHFHYLPAKISSVVPQQRTPRKPNTPYKIKIHTRIPQTHQNLVISIIHLHITVKQNWRLFSPQHSTLMILSPFWSQINYLHTRRSASPPNHPTKNGQTSKLSNQLTPPKHPTTPSSSIKFSKTANFPIPSIPNSPSKSNILRPSSDIMHTAPTHSLFYLSVNIHISYCSSSPCRPIHSKPASWPRSS